MAAEVEFDEFVRVRSGRLLRAAYALTGDHARAEDLLQTALARCWAAWRRIDGDPEPYVRRSLVNTYNSWWQRRWRHEVPSETLPDRAQDPAQERVGERDEVWRALGRLPRQQRTVLVLRYFEDLTETQVAQTLGISVGAVKSTASKGLSRLRTDESLLALAMPEVPSGIERVAAVRERITARRRSRIVITSAAVAIVLAVLAVYAIGHHRNDNHPVHPIPSPSISPAFSLPEWGSEGEHLLTSRQETVSTNVVLLSYPVSDQSFHVHYGCLAPSLELSRRVGIWIELVPSGSDDGTVLFGVKHECELNSSHAGLSWRRGVGQDARAFDVRITFTVDGERLESGVLPGDMTVWAAIAEWVPFEQYAFPSRPADLKKLPPLTEGGLSAANGYARTVRRGEQWQSACVYSQTPGVFHLTADGKEISTLLTIWDYSGSGRCDDLPPLKPGTTIRATAEHVTGEWIVSMSRCANSELNCQRSLSASRSADPAQRLDPSPRRPRSEESVVRHKSPTVIGL